MADVDIRKVFADPVFRGLSSIEKMNAMDELDPEFKSLAGPKEKADAIQQLLHQVPMAPKDQGFWSTLGHDVAALPGMLGTVGRAAQGDLGAVTALGTPNLMEAVKSRSAMRQGRTSEAVGHGIAAELPGAGPIAAQGAEEISGGQPGQGAAHLLEVLGPAAAGGLRGTRAGSAIAETAEGAARGTADVIRKGAPPATRAAVKVAENVVPKLVTDALPPGLLKVFRALKSSGKSMSVAEQEAALFEEANGRKPNPKNPRELITARNLRQQAIKEDIASRQPPKAEKPPPPPTNPREYVEWRKKYPDAPAVQPKPGPGTGTKYGGPSRSQSYATPQRGDPNWKPPVRQEPVAEAAAAAGEVEATAPKPATAPPTSKSTPSATPGQAQSGSMNPRTASFDALGPEKNSYMAQHFADKGMTPEQVEAMPDEVYKVEMIKVGKGLKDRGLRKVGFKLHEPNNPRSRPYHIQKIEIADAMRKAAGGQQ